MIISWIIKKNLVPVVLVVVMALSIAGAVVYRHWLFMFIAAELIVFHLTPPFAVLLSVVAYKNKLGFWFNQSEREKSFYKKIRVKQWKDKFPTYDAKMFAVNSASKEKLIKLMIQSENVHLLLFFLSFVPVVLGNRFGHRGAMILLSFIIAACHVPFVIIQRFNIPRVVALKTNG
ncbi:MAG: hypothetical protein MJ183_00710 [Treponemataceae bacterium]|nr:hypothetical protein [Treponemataceae bacterium]